jgi:thiamine pyrophosphate-dependent acetolactate synthase large subunit-like protein
MSGATDTAVVAPLAADRLLEALQQLGVELVFGLPGVHNLPLWRALSESSIRLVGVRHEQSAVYAADGYARATGKLGVALVTTGPGAANTLGATGEAMASGSPVLVIATDIPTTLRRPGVYRGVLHETRDQGAMFAPVTKGTRTVASAETLAGEALAAGALALAAPSGPVYLGVPTNLLSAPAGAPPAPIAPEASTPPADADLDAALALLAQSRRPLIWAGGGALRAGAGEAVDELARRLVAPVVTTYMARGLLAPDHPCAVPGPVHLPVVGTLWDEADLVIAIGSDFDGMMTQNWSMPAPARLLAINVDPADAAKNYTPDLTLAGDARTVTASLAARVPARDGIARMSRRLDELGRDVRAAVEEDDPQAARLLDAVRETLPDDAVLVLDMCIAGYWLGGFHPAPAPRTLQYPVGWGTLGFGFPAALGAAAAGRGRAVAVCGDGGFLFACGELATAAQEQLPLTVVLVDDGGYGMLRFDQVHAGEQAFGVDLHTPDFAALAAAFGIPAHRERGFGAGFVARLEESLSADGPVVIVVDAALKPPPTTSPRWYRRRVAASPVQTDQESHQ